MERIKEVYRIGGKYVMKKVINIRSWPTTVHQLSEDEVLERKKRKRIERIKETKEKINEIRNKK
jgi:hypothetical protein